MDEASIRSGSGSTETELLRWLEGICAATVTASRQLVGGNRRKAWAVDLRQQNGEIREVFLRFASTDAAGADPYDLRREADVYQALVRTRVAIAKTYGIHPRRQAVALERVHGESSYRSLQDSVQRERIAQSFMRAVHELHRLDPATLPLHPRSPKSIAECVRNELAIWRAMYAEASRADPLIEFAFHWLEQNVRAVPRAPVLVHGDCGPGNFMFRGDTVVALVDWELWHWGDPVEDLAWLSMRCVLEPFPDFAQRIREYEALSGAAVDRVRLLYHRIFVALRVVVIRHRALDEPSTDSDMGNSIVSRTLNRRLLTEALLTAQGVAAPPAMPLEAPPSPQRHEFDFLLAQLRDTIVPSLSDPLARSRAKSLARVVKYLQQVDRYGGEFGRLQAIDLQEALGEPEPDSDEVAAQNRLCEAIRSGRADAGRVLHYLAGQSVRESALGKPAIGALATRTWDEVDA